MASDKDLQDVNRSLKEISRSLRDTMKILETLNYNFAKAVTHFIETKEEDVNANRT